VYKILSLLACALVLGAGCGSDSEAGSGGGDSPCEENIVPGPNLPGGEDVLFTIESSSGTRHVPGKVTGTRRGELELRAQCLPSNPGRGFSIAFDMRIPSEPGTYDAETPHADPDEAAMGEKAIGYASANYFAQKETAHADLSNVPFEEHTEAWRMHYGVGGSAQVPFLTDDFVLELTELSPYEGEDLPWFETVPHGSVTLTLLPARGMMDVIDDSRDPITLTAEF